MVPVEPVRHEQSHQIHPAELLGNFLFLYPSFDYTSPAGIHFGVSAEIRDNQAQFGNNTNSTLYAYQAIGYVSSDRFGRFQFGTPNGSVTNLAVGTGDDFGTGDFFAYYGTTPYVPWVMGDSYDNYVPMQKLTYTTPTWAGFKAEISWQPSAVSLTDSYSQTNGSGGVTAIMPTPGLLSRNRVELAGQYVGNFGPVSLKANGGWVVANPSPTDGLSIAGQNVSFGNAGIEVHVAGLEVESSVVSGKYSYATTDNGNPMGPLPEGAKGTTAWIAGVGYSIGPLKAGVMLLRRLLRPDGLQSGWPLASRSRFRRRPRRNLYGWAGRERLARRDHCDDSGAAYDGQRLPEGQADGRRHRLEHVLYLVTGLGNGRCRLLSG